MRQKPFVIAITGASGSLYGIRLVKVMLELGRPVALSISPAARLVMREEQGIEIKDLRDASFLESVFGPDAGSKMDYYPHDEMTAPIASGSYPTQGMVIIPASTAAFSKIANGITGDLIERAAECTIKEGRRLVIVPRETPLSAIHLENLLKLARLGVRVVPAIPAFYSGAQQVEELVDFLIGKVLDQLDIEHALYRRWTGTHDSVSSGDTSWKTS